MDSCGCVHVPQPPRHLHAHMYRCAHEWFPTCTPQECAWTSEHSVTSHASRTLAHINRSTRRMRPYTHVRLTSICTCGAARMCTRKCACPNEHLHACPRIYRDNCVRKCAPYACNTWNAYTGASTRICPTCSQCAHTQVRNYEPIPIQGAHMCA